MCYTYDVLVEQVLHYADFIAADGLLAIFFFVIGLDLMDELKNGDLRDAKHATLPAIAAFGGVIAPAVLYFALIHFNGLQLYESGWAIPTATDVAFSLAVLQIFKKKVKKGTHLFLLVLAVVDDIIGILIIAVAFSSNVNPFALLIEVGLLIAWALLVRQEKVIIPLAVIVAVGAWTAMFLANIHPTIAGVCLGIMVPAQRSAKLKKGLAITWSEFFTPICNRVVVPVFAVTAIITSIYELISAFSLPDHKIDPGVYHLPIIVAVALIVGKPLGILTFTWIAHHLTPLKLFHGLKTRDLFGVSCLGGIGFTVSFLVASLSFSDPLVVAFCRIGVVIGSVLSALIGFGIIKFTTRKC
ncbi:MAG: Na+/H+ antiporter NhaA [Candidatus Ancillula sp.]|jgi:NhaA family Na+:H+ antiporter|nr:Na+/H+ antiporter NhaA [Candidatus Ancillula sp.]